MIVTAPAAFRFTYSAAPERHDRAAALLGLVARPPGPEALPDALRALMTDLGAPDASRALGYGEADIPELVQGALAQQRLLAVAPREPSDDDLASILRASL